MNKKQETILDKPLGGLSLMIFLTAIWTILGGFNIKGKDYYILTTLFTLLILFFVYSYVKINKQTKIFPKSQINEDPKKERLYWAIIIAEGIAILLVNIILTIIHKDELFISSFVLIVGLHFFPLAKVFDRKFDYYIGTWTTLFAIGGIILTTKNAIGQSTINSFVCFACAISTASYGLKMISDAKRLYEQNKDN